MHRRKLDATINAMHAIDGFKGKAGAEICIEHPISLGFPGEMEKFCTPANMSDVDNRHTLSYLRS